MGDIIELLKAIRAEWAVVIAHPEAFGAIGCLGLLLGWSGAWLILKQRLTHHRELVDHYKDVLAEKAPALVRSEQNLTPKFGGLRVLLYGALLIGLGYIALVFIKLPPSTGLKFSRMQVANWQIVDSSDPLTFNVYLQNMGNLAATGLTHTDGAIILDHEATDSELDVVFDVMKDKSAKFLLRPESEIQPSQIVFYTLPYVVAASDYEQVKNGPKILYLFVLISTADAASASNEHNVTEACVYTFRGQAFHQCLRHNRIYHD